MENKFLSQSDWSFEAFVVQAADDIAQRTHDISDSFELNLMRFKLIIEMFENNFQDLLSTKDRDFLSRFSTGQTSIYDVKEFTRFLTGFYITRLVEDASKVFKYLNSDMNISSHREFNECKKSITLPVLSNKLAKQGLGNLNEESANTGRNPSDECNLLFWGDLKKADSSFQKGLRPMIINSSIVQDSDGRASYIISSLFKKYVSNPLLLPDRTILSFLKNVDIEGYNRLKASINIHDTSHELAKLTRDRLLSDLFVGWEVNEDVYNVVMRLICDYISGMTDHYADKKFKLLHGISPYS